MYNYGKLISEMMSYYHHDPEQVNHFMKVFAYALTIADCEDIDAEEREILLTAAILHDVGCKLCKEKYGSTAGHLQEIEGPAIAEEMMEKLGYDSKVIERVSYLVGHHHSYDNIDGIDYQILVEADFLVNIDESEKYYRQKEAVLKKIFRTETGISIYNDLFS